MKKLFRIYCLLGLAMFTFACSKDSDTDQTPQSLEVKIELTNSYPAVGELVEVKITAVSGTAVSAEWNWGDGAVSKELTGIHTYSSDGEYTLTLTAKDNSGKTISKSEKIKVEGMGLTKFIKDYDRKRVLIMAHRGNTGDKRIPENSIAAIQSCIVNKDVLDFVEIDPRTTKDGVIILMHDETVDRTTTGKGKVKELSFSEIQKLKLKLEDGTETTQSVPTLQEVLLKARGKVFINLDFIDNVSPKEIYDLARNCGMLDRVMFSTATKKDVVETMLSYSKTIHILGQYSGEGDENFLSTTGGGGRIAFTYITPAKALSTNYSGLLFDKGFIPASQILDQNGFSYDSQMMSGNYTGINLFLENKFLLLQTDYPKTLHAYLKSQGKR